MGVQVKICGINTAAAADAVASAGAHYCGLVFFPHSPRALDAEQAASLAARLRGRVRIVALTVNATDPELEAVVNACRPDLLQLHGQESPQRVGAIRHRFGLPVMKVIAVADMSDLAAVPAYERVADMLLFDAKAPASDRPGGHGTAFDWQVLRGRKFVRPWLLAGGLNAENVARAIRCCDAPGVDCSSGVESAPGVKEPHLIRAFVAAAHSAQFVEAQS